MRLKRNGNIGGVGALLPIIVRRDQQTIRVMQVENRIWQKTGDAERAQRRTESADGNSFGIGARENEATDQLVRIGLDAATRGDIKKLLRARRYLHLHDLIRPAILAEVGITAHWIKSGGA